MKSYGMTLAEGAEIGNLTVPRGTAFPTPANAGELFYRTDTDTLYLYSTAWTPIATAQDGVLSPLNTFGGTTGWRDLKGDINVRGNGSNNPVWAAFRDGLYAYDFHASVMNEAWVSYHIDHDYAPGTPVYLHAHWAPKTVNTGVVRFGFEYAIAKGHDQEAFPTSTTVYVESNISSNRQYKHMVAEIGTGISSASIEPDSLILVRIFRDATHINDTFPDVAPVLTADCHYQADRVATKNRAPNFYA